MKEREPIGLMGGEKRIAAPELAFLWVLLFSVAVIWLLVTTLALT